MSKFNIEETLRRVRNLYSVEMNKDLAEVLGLGKSTISGWVSRNSIPNEILFKISEEKNVSLDWLVYGKKEQRKLDSLENLLLTAFNKLDDDAKIGIISLLHTGGKTGTGNTIQNTVGDNSSNNIFSGDNLTINHTER